MLLKGFATVLVNTVVSVLIIVIVVSSMLWLVALPQKPAGVGDDVPPVLAALIPLAPGPLVPTEDGNKPPVVFSTLFAVLDPVPGNAVLLVLPTEDGNKPLVVLCILFESGLLLVPAAQRRLPWGGRSSEFMSSRPSLMVMRKHEDRSWPAQSLYAGFRTCEI